MWGCNSHSFLVQQHSTQLLSCAAQQESASTNRQPQPAQVHACAARAHARVIWGCQITTAAASDHDRRLGLHNLGTDALLLLPFIGHSRHQHLQCVGAHMWRFV